jgi:ATP-dependent exoDNAse (exonuclease V) alpha subunit
VLAEHTGIQADTLAKLTWGLKHHDLPDWAAHIDGRTLMIIDEAGMADSLSLDTAIQYAIDRGASVRLIGDNQQLAAIGAGGILRDIKHSHGALHLSELHRFTDPAEAAASLALRDGDPRALRFYLDHRRVHVGDLAKATEDAFTAWIADRTAGLDAIMLAPTRELVADLNRRARDHRLGGASPRQEVELSDGSQASVGDVIITRTNDRRLRLSATDWVKNGDRWTITHITKQGDLRVRHTRSHRTVRLPADYVRASTSLGYATTIHGAQGVSADTVHGLVTGQESRQQLYTMLTRGRHANHLYLQVVGDGDPHSVVRPDTVAPRTPTEACSRSSPATTPPPPPPPSCANSTTPPPACTTPSSVTPTPSTSRPNSSSDHRPCPSSTKPIGTSPDSPPNPHGQACDPICSHSRPKPVSTHSATCWQPSADATSKRRVTWPPSWTGA